LNLLYSILFNYSDLSIKFCFRNSLLCVYK